ncbi:MAG: STAS domain-containing protein [Brevinema sp.]
MIYTGVQNQDLHVVIDGKGTVEYCSELEAWIQELLSNLDVEHIYFDTKKACYLDSSFIGIILSAKKKLAKKQDAVILLNPSDKIVEIFQLMGLDTFVPAVYNEDLICEHCGVEINKKIENSISDIKLLLDAHKNIMETSSENHKRFMLVEKVFQKELKQRQYSN